MSEETWRKIGETGFAAAADWPDLQPSKTDTVSDELELLIKQTLEDTQEIIATTKLSPKKVHYYTAAKWKWRVYIDALTRASTNPETLDGLIRDMLSAKVATAKDLPKFAAKIVQQSKKMPAELRSRKLDVGEIDERGVFDGSTDFLQQRIED